MTARNNTATRVVCVILAVLMFLLMFLPVMKPNVTESFLEEFSDDLDIDEQLLIEAISEVDFLEGVAKKFSKLKLSDFGRKSNSYGYEDGSLEDRIWDLEAEIEDTLEEELDDILFYGGDFDDLKRFLKSDTTQSLIAEYLFASIVYASYEDGVSNDKAVNKTVKNFQTIMKVGTKNKLTPVQYYRELNAIVNIVSETDNSFLSGYLDRSTMMKLESAIRSLKTVRVLNFIFLVVYAVFTLLAVVGSVLSKKSLARLSGIVATVLAVIYTIILYVARAKIVDGIESAMNGFHSFDKMITITAWPIIIILVGVVFCVFVSGIEKRGYTQSKGWICPQCGGLRKQEEAFCANCGTKRPEVRNLFCQQCGARVESGDVFCPECGSRLNSRYVTM